MGSEGDLLRILLGWLEADPNARFVVRSDGALLWSNPAAHALCAACGQLTIAQGMLTSPDSQVADRLRRFLETLNAEARSGTCVIPASDGDGVLWLRATWIGRGEAPAICLQALSTGRTFEARYQDYDVAFQLTPAEHRIVEMTLDGLTAEQIAEHISGSLGTVRTHIRNVYRKMKVNNREGMFNKIKPFRVT